MRRFLHYVTRPNPTEILGFRDYVRTDHAVDYHTPNRQLVIKSLASYKFAYLRTTRLRACITHFDDRTTIMIAIGERRIDISINARQISLHCGPAICTVALDNHQQICDSIATQLMAAYNYLTFEKGSFHTARLPTMIIGHANDTTDTDAELQAALLAGAGADSYTE